MSAGITYSISSSALSPSSATDTAKSCALRSSTSTPRLAGVSSTIKMTGRLSADARMVFCAHLLQPAAQLLHLIRGGVAAQLGEKSRVRRLRRVELRELVLQGANVAARCELDQAR